MTLECFDALPDHSRQCEYAFAGVIGKNSFSTAHNQLEREWSADKCQVCLLCQFHVNSLVYRVWSSTGVGPWTHPLPSCIQLTWWTSWSLMTLIRTSMWMIPKYTGSVSQLLQTNFRAVCLGAFLRSATGCPL